MAGNGNNGNNSVDMDQEPFKREKAYKVTCGTFKNKNKALQEAAEAKRKGVNVSLVINKAGYMILCADGLTKSEADTIKKAIDVKKLKSEVSEQ